MANETIHISVCADSDTTFGFFANCTNKDGREGYLLEHHLEFYPGGAKIVVAEECSRSTRWQNRISGAFEECGID